MKTAGCSSHSFVQCLSVILEHEVTCVKKYHLQQTFSGQLSSTKSEPELSSVIQ